MWINALGLSFGLALSFLTVLFVMDELSWEGFRSQCEDIYRITKIWTKGEIAHHATTLAALGPAVSDEVTGIVNVAKSVSAYGMAVKSDGKIFIGSRIAFADPSILELFSLPAITRNMDRTLSDPQPAPSRRTPDGGGNKV